MNLPKINSYASNSPNYGTHCLCFEWGDLEIYFSYKTMVAFRDPRNGQLVCVQNYWGPTTGKHLNAIQPDKKQRLAQDAFDARWEEATANLRTEPK